MDEMIVVIKPNENLKLKRKTPENGDPSGLAISNSVVC